MTPDTKQGNDKNITRVPSYLVLTIGENNHI